MSQFFGKYRGKVENNLDPLQQGRVQVSVPAVLGEGRASWAMPCVPFAGNGVGLFLIRLPAPTSGSNSRAAIPTIRFGAVVSGEPVRRRLRRQSPK